MTDLETSLRSLLEKAVLEAREIAENGARKALARLGIENETPPAVLSEAESDLHHRLRVHQSTIGGFESLLTECAYEHWHRMLFARFLAENGLLRHDEYGVPVSLQECNDLAAELGTDGWALAARFASHMLPRIFRSDDPVLEVPLAPEDRHRLERLVMGLPSIVFTADDSLGWVYQFWQTKKKKEVNDSEVKIDGKTIGPVTQLFTEHYMVQFLLQNTLGAWWVARHPGEDLPLSMEYLRREEDGTPIAGGFPEWPATAAELRVIDPCCGSGHFLVAAFEILQRFRMVEERLSEAEAGDAVLRENLHGLEIDARCVQIAAFALALVAWKRGGYRDLPRLSVACCGTPVESSLEEWLKLAGGDHRLEQGMRVLHRTFLQAPDLGSLIDPSQASEANLFVASFDELRGLLSRAMEAEGDEIDENLAQAGVAAEGIATAAELLTGKYHLVCTNVPYLQRGRQANGLRTFIEQQHSRAKNDLATAFVERCLALCASGGTTAVVTPQNWLFLGTYKRMREDLLKRVRWEVVARLGPGGFTAISGEVVSVAGLLISSIGPPEAHEFAAIDAQEPRVPEAKSRLLMEGDIVFRSQIEQLGNPDARVVLGERSPHNELSTLAHGVHGLGSKDTPRFFRQFWEIAAITDDWSLMQTTVDRTVAWGGMEQVVYWQQGAGVLWELGQRGWAVLAGRMAWGRRGVCVSQMGGLPCALYQGNIFDKNAAVILPNDPAHLPAIWAFCSSPEFAVEVRKIDQKLNVTNATLVKVPFDLERWQKVAEEMGPLPEPYSEDPTQWLFKGHPALSTEPLQVAVARLLGYRWPEQEDDGLDALADKDGIVCLPSLQREPPAEDRLRALLAAAYEGQDTAPPVPPGGKPLGEWLRDDFFSEHCRLFHQRPFIWHIWDGRKDGFSVLVNYHKLDRQLLGRLTHTYLGEWITRQKQADQDGEAGAAGRLEAASKLQRAMEAILEGEAPYDIFVRWKPMEQQPIGWEPDLNDGVRLNIRPFMEAGILRAKPGIKWNKDRGKNPPGAPWGEDRINDRHLRLEEKRAARR